MHVVGSFKYSTYIELATLELEHRGVPQEDIIIVPFEWEDPNIPSVTLAHKGDPTGINLTFVIGSILMLLGCIYGFVLPLGPILWGLIGAVLGAVIGYIADVVMVKRKKQTIQGMTEVVLIVKCDENVVKEIRRVLWENQALGVAVIPG